MAQIVLGIGSSHAPSASTPVSEWELHAKRDAHDQELWYRGRQYKYPDLVALRRGDEDWASAVTPQQWHIRNERCHRATGAIRDALKAAQADVVVIIGDDQHEMFYEDSIPALAIYCADAIRVTPRALEKIAPAIRSARTAMYGDREFNYPCAGAMARHIVERTVQAGFDITQATQVAPGRTLGHAYNFFYQRLLDDGYVGVPQIVPIFVNAAHPPNQPSASRLVEFGKALRQAIASWPGNERVVVMASGGMSHFVVDEQLDRSVLAALQRSDTLALASIPGDHLLSSTGEIRNWIGVGGALSDFRMELLDYVPLYRTPAGTGIGMAYALWHAGPSRTG